MSFTPGFAQGDLRIVGVSLPETQGDITKILGQKASCLKQIGRVHNKQKRHLFHNLFSTLSFS